MLGGKKVKVKVWTYETVLLILWLCVKWFLIKGKKNVNYVNQSGKNERKILKHFTAPLILTFFNRSWLMQSGFTDNSTVADSLRDASPCASVIDVTDNPSKLYTYVRPSWYALLWCTISEKANTLLHDS